MAAAVQDLHTAISTAHFQANHPEPLTLPGSGLPAELPREKPALAAVLENMDAACWESVPLHLRES